MTDVQAGWLIIFTAFAIGGFVGWAIGFLTGYWAGKKRTHPWEGANIKVRSGAAAGLESKIERIDGNTITLKEPLSKP